jgi:hypothetical protein
MPHPIRERIACGELCRHLRTKGMYVLGDDGPPPDLPHPPGTAVHWCVQSGWAMGPDLAPANPDRCAKGEVRDCFEPDVTG